MENSWEYNLLKCIITAITFGFQFVLMLTVRDAPVPYLLSNISILCGYILDLVSLRRTYPTLKVLIVTVLIINALSLVLGLSDIMCLSSVTNKDLYHITNEIIPVFTLVALFTYTVLCVVVLIKLDKDTDCF